MTRRHPTNPDNRFDECVFHVSIDTTSHCNLHCPHCWMESVRRQGYSFQNKVMPFDLFTRICGDFRGRCSTFGLSCGYEPLLNPDLPRFVEYAVGAGLPDVHFYTNGVLLTAETAERVVAAGLSRMVFSLEGTDAATFEKYRTGSTWERFLGAVRLADAARRAAGSIRPTLRFNWVVTADNLDQLPQLPALAARLAVDEIYLMPELRWQQTYEGEDHVFEVRREEAAVALEGFESACATAGVAGDSSMIRLQHPDLFGELPAAASHTSLPACLQPWSVMVITSEGIVAPCWATMTTRSYGDFRRQSLEEIWTSAPHRELRAGLQGDAPPCADCTQCIHWRPDGQGPSYSTPRWLDASIAATLLPLHRRR